MKLLTQSLIILFIILIYPAWNKVGASSVHEPTKAELCESGDAKACVDQAFESENPLLWNKKACNIGGAVGCANVAASYYGEGHIDKSRMYFQKACELKDFISCSNLGVFAEQEKKVVSAVSYFGKACLLGHGPSCVSWKNNASKLCQSDFKACMKLVEELRTSKELIDADYLLNVACKAGYGSACP